ncbi:MAG: universal stress protein, partial [Aureliella sp.]
ATDTRLDRQRVVDKAGKIASENHAAVTIVDVVPEISWIASKLTSDLVHMRSLYAQEVEAKLESLATTLRDRGVDVTTKVLTGKASVEIAREVLRERHDLLMVVAKGKNSQRKGSFGYTATHLLQTCPSAVWLVVDKPATRINHVLGCVDVSSDHPEDLELNDKVFELTSTIGEFLGARHSLLHAWRMQDEALLSSRLQHSVVTGFTQDYYESTKKSFDQFLRFHDSSLDADGMHLLKGRAPEVIERFVRDNAIDLIVMGTLARSGIAGMLIGNTAEQVLDRIECSLLALKPYSFASPIKMKSYTRLIAGSAS